MISIAMHVYRAGDNLNEGEPLKTIIIGAVDSLLDEEDADLDAKAFGEDIIGFTEEFDGDLDVVVEFRRIES